jgi:hypothetical protein
MEEIKMEKKVNTPKKGAAKKWAERWKKLREQPASEELIDKLNQKEKLEKVAQPQAPNDVEV